MDPSHLIPILFLVWTIAGPGVAAILLFTIPPDLADRLLIQLLLGLIAGPAGWSMWAGLSLANWLDDRASARSQTEALRFYRP